jgi:hypothetical protein
MIIGKNQDMRGKITTMIRAGNGLKLRVTCSHGHISKTIKKNTEISQPDKSMDHERSPKGLPYVCIPGNRDGPSLHSLCSLQVATYDV